MLYGSIVVVRNTIILIKKAEKRFRLEFSLRRRNIKKTEANALARDIDQIVQIYWSRFAFLLFSSHHEGFLTSFNINKIGVVK